MHHPLRGEQRLTRRLRFRKQERQVNTRRTELALGTLGALGVHRLGGRVGSGLLAVRRTLVGVGGGRITRAKVGEQRIRRTGWVQRLLRRRSVLRIIRTRHTQQRRRSAYTQLRRIPARGGVRIVLVGRRKRR